MIGVAPQMFTEQTDSPQLARCALPTVPDRGFTADDLNRARRLVDELGHSELPSVATGSLAAGLGHAFSDIDVYVVTDRETESMTREDDERGRLDLLRVPWAEAARLLGSAAAFTATADDRDQLSLPEKQLSVLVRLVLGVPLRSTPEFDALRAAVDRGALRRIVMGRHAQQAAIVAEDAAGALATGDAGTALVASRQAVEAACEVVLGCAGDVYQGRKFLWRRLGRAAAARAVGERAYALLAAEPDVGDARAVEAAVLDRLDLTTGLVAECLLRGWDEPPRTVAVPPPARGAARRAAGFGLIRFTDSIALAGPRCGFAVTEEMAWLWLALHAGAVPDVRLAWSAGTGRPITDDEIRTAVHDLIDVGAATGSAW